MSLLTKNRGSPPNLFLGKGVLKICSKFTGDFPVSLLHIFRTTFPKSTSEGPLLNKLNVATHLLNIIKNGNSRFNALTRVQKDTIKDQKYPFLCFIKSHLLSFNMDVLQKTSLE